MSLGCKHSRSPSKSVLQLAEGHCGADTHCLSDIDSGKLPEWENKPAPDIAKWYWKMPKVGFAVTCLVFHRLGDVV